jgi:hypothetical protein
MPTKTHPLTAADRRTIKRVIDALTNEADALPANSRKLTDFLEGLAVQLLAEFVPNAVLEGV